MVKPIFIIAVLSISASIFSVQAASSKKFNFDKPPLVSHKIDLNKATVTALSGSIKGIGKKRAEAIIAYRNSHHGFKSLEELSDVKGIGQGFLTANREKLNQVFTLSPIEKI